MTYKGPHAYPYLVGTELCLRPSSARGIPSAPRIVAALTNQPQRQQLTLHTNIFNNSPDTGIRAQIQNPIRNDIKRSRSALSKEDIIYRSRVLGTQKGNYKTQSRECVTERRIFSTIQSRRTGDILDGQLDWKWILDFTNVSMDGKMVELFNNLPSKSMLYTRRQKRQLLPKLKQSKLYLTRFVVRLSS